MAHGELGEFIGMRLTVCCLGQQAMPQFHGWAGHPVSRRHSKEAWHTFTRSREPAKHHGYQCIIWTMICSTRHPRPLAIIADDNALIRLDVADILENAGYTVVEARHGDHAMSMLHEHHQQVHVLFTDVQMPGGSRDGFALAREVAVSWPHIAIVVASGEMRPEPGDLPEGSTFIGKPFNADVVRDHLRKVVDDAKQPDALRRKD